VLLNALLVTSVQVLAIVASRFTRNRQCWLYHRLLVNSLEVISQFGDTIRFNLQSSARRCEAW